MALFAKPQRVNRGVVRVCSIIALLIHFSDAIAATSPTLPQELVDTTYSQPTGATITVPAGGDLQSAIDRANPGDPIVLIAGATYTGNFILRNKSGSRYIHIESSALSTLPRPGTRVSPAYQQFMPKVVSPNVDPAFRTERGVHHY